MLHHAMGCEFKPWWWQTLFRTQAKHLCFLHVSIWFILFKTIICHLNCVTENWKWNLFLKSISFTSMWPTVELTPDTRPWLSCRQRRRGFSRSLLASIVLRLKGGSQSYQNAHFLKNGPIPASYSFIFGLFQTNNTIFTTNQCENVHPVYCAGASKTWAATRPGLPQFWLC